MDTKERLHSLYQRLASHFGPQHWWPAETSFEVAVGAILAQNTAWTNAARAIANLKEADLLSCESLLALEPERLAQLIRPAGYFNLKTARLRALLRMLAEHHGGEPRDLARLPLPQARERLLAVKGVGPETADSILLYAAGMPIFVVDAYTVRVMTRHQLAAADWDYHRLQDLFMSHLPASTGLYNEFHALLVRLGNGFCRRTRYDCSLCPARDA